MNYTDIQQELIRQGFLGKKIISTTEKIKATPVPCPLEKIYDYYSINTHMSNTAMSNMQTQKKLHHFLNPPPKQFGEYDEKDVFRVGRAYHEAILEPQKFANSFRTKPNCQSKKGKVEFQELKEQGFTLLSENECKVIQEIQKNVNLDILENCLYEQDVFFEIEGIKCKSKVDAIAHDGSYFIDLKFVRDANPEKFGNAFFRYDYDRQLAFYRLGLLANGLISKDAKTYILAVEKTAPYDYGLYEVSEETLVNAETKIRTGLEFWEEYQEDVKKREVLKSYKIEGKL